jgi:hypothetical protein
MSEIKPVLILALFGVCYLASALTGIRLLLHKGEPAVTWR